MSSAQKMARSPRGSACLPPLCLYPDHYCSTFRQHEFVLYDRRVKAMTAAVSLSPAQGHARPDLPELRSAAEFARV